MTYDPIEARRALKEKRGFDWAALLAFLLVFIGSMVIFLRETQYEYVDFRVHMMIAGDFDFTDLHSITSRLAYPMWHLLVSVLYQLGLPLEWAAAGVTAACKGVTFWLVYELITVLSRGEIRRWVVALLSTLLMIVTCFYIPSVSLFVYKGVGSPNVWHNPTQQAVITAMMLVMPWLAHCWYMFENRLQHGEANITIPWRNVLILSVLGMASLACKPTFMQALLPAAFVMYLVEVFRHPRQWRYFGQIVLAFLPCAAYFLLQYLYYTGVVVAFTSGVTVGITAQSAWLAVRNMLMMSAAPLLSVLVCYRKGMFKNRLLVLALLMILFSTLEVMAFEETGMRAGHGNFAWAAGSSSFFLWVVMSGVFLRTFIDDLSKKELTVSKAIGYGCVIPVFAWQVYSGVYYLTYLMNTSNAF